MNDKSWESTGPRGIGGGQKWVACLALLFLLQSLFGGPVGAQDGLPHQQRIESLVRPYLDHDKFVGASIGILYDGREYYLNYGQASVGGAETTADTIYEIGSISKVFTGILLADAVERGELKLDQTLGSLLPELQPDAEVAQITLQELTHHLSGLPRMPSNLRPRDPANPFADYDRQRLHEFLGRVTLQGKGERYLYSNVAVGLLGDLLAQHAGGAYGARLRERILAPLAMEDTGIVLSEVQRQRLAGPHNAAGVPDHEWEFDALVGAGGIRSTTRDLVKFMRANLQTPEGQLGQALDLAWQEHLQATPEHRAMGLGWMIAGDGDARWHNGQTGGYQSMLLASRDRGLGVVVLANTAGSGIDPLAEGIYRALLGIEEVPQTFEPLAEVTPETAARLAGRYRLGLFAVLEVKAFGNKLMVQLTGQPALPVFPESDTVWKYRAVEAQLQFDLPEGEGPATSVTLLQDGRVLPARRIESP